LDISIDHVLLPERGPEARRQFAYKRVEEEEEEKKEEEKKEEEKRNAYTNVYGKQ
jgi:ribosomal protein L12E/L44/L45/RPP1/RPP2